MPLRTSVLSQVRLVLASLPVLLHSCVWPASLSPAAACIAAAGIRSKRGKRLGKENVFENAGEFSLIVFEMLLGGNGDLGGLHKVADDAS